MTTFIPILIKTAILIGTSIGACWLGITSYTSHIASNYGLIVPEVEGKYQYYLEHGWTDMNAIVDFAETNGLKVHYHTLIWYPAIPPDPCAWITEAMTRYPTIKDWDVLNEGWTATGPTSSVDVVEIYRCARRVRPDARLWYNGVFSTQYEREQALWLLRNDLADGIGVQFHVGLGWDLSERWAAVKAVEAMGSPWRVSELDVRLLLPPSLDDIDAQAALYAEIAAYCRNSRTCANITVWGAADQYSWIPGTFDGWGLATPFDVYYQPKVFWDAMK